MYLSRTWIGRMKKIEAIQLDYFNFVVITFVLLTYTQFIYLLKRHSKTDKSIIFRV